MVRRAASGSRRIANGRSCDRANSLGGNGKVTVLPLWTVVLGGCDSVSTSTFSVMLYFSSRSPARGFFFVILHLPRPVRSRSPALRPRCSSLQRNDPDLLLPLPGPRGTARSCDGEVDPPLLGGIPTRLGHEYVQTMRGRLHSRLEIKVVCVVFEVVAYFQIHDYEMLQTLSLYVSFIARWFFFDVSLLLIFLMEHGDLDF